MRACRYFKDTSTHTHNPATVCKNLSASVFMCWQRQAVRCLPAAQPPEGKRQTLYPIYRNTARHQKDSLSPQQHPCWSIQVALRVGVSMIQKLLLSLNVCIHNIHICLCVSMIPLKCSLWYWFLSACKQDRSPEDVHPPHR